MALGYDQEIKVVVQNDTVDLYAFLYNKDDQPVDPSLLLSVTYVIQSPDNAKTTVAGSVQDDGSGFLQYGGTAQIGHYAAVATFLFNDGTKKSTRVNFEVFDPFEDTPATQTNVLTEAVWRKLEDCFDAEDAGPWLRDMTLDFFNEEKMNQFVSEAMFDINFQNPPTQETILNFIMVDGTATTDLPLLAQGVFLCVLRQLMRAYTEQPLPQGAQIAYQDRRDYLQRWQSIYQIEQQTYMRWLALWKRQFLQLGHSKVLVASKAGRLIPAPLRTRSVGRGYW